MTFEFRDPEDIAANQREVRQWVEARKRALQGIMETEHAVLRALDRKAKKPRQRPGSR